MVQKGGRFRVADAVIFVHGLRHQTGIQLGKVGFHSLFQSGAVFASGFFDGGAQGFGGLGRVAEQHFAGRGEIDLFQCAVPPLGQKVERSNGIDLIVPVFHTGGLVHVRRVDVHDITAHAELPRAVHLTAAHIPGGEQPGYKALAVVYHAGLEGESVFQKFVPGHSVLQKCLGRHAHGLQPPAGQCTQHRKAAVFVLAARAFHRTQHEVPGREHFGRKPQRPEVIRKVGGFRFAGGHDAQHAAEVFL